MRKLFVILILTTLVSCSDKPITSNINDEKMPEDFSCSPWKTIISKEHFIDSYRMFVPHGWIVLSRIDRGSLASTFIYDEQHEWKV